MDKTKQPSRARLIWAGGVIALLVLGWLARDALWRVAQAATAEMTQLSAECRQP